MPLLREAIVFAQRDHAQLQEDHELFKKDHAQFLQDHAQMQQTMQQIKQQVKQELEQNIKQQISSTKQEVEQRIQQDIKKIRVEIEKEFDDIVEPLRENPQSEVYMRDKVAALSAELQDLIAKLEDCGIFKPDIPETTEDAPVVGTIELEEDIYTTRLLMRLGFMRGVTQQISADTDRDKDAHRDAYDSSSDDSSALNDRFHGIQPLSPEYLANISGLNVPEAEIGSASYYTVTRGFAGVCVATGLTQVLILAIFIKYGLGEGNCIEHETFLDQILLRVSKLLAMLVLGGMMGSEFMGIVTYWMVCDLLLDTKDKEFAFTALFQMLMSVAVIIANVLVFMQLTAPGDVWLNLTALTFIAGLDSDVLGMAKQGFFGHAVAKSVLEVNYELTFVAQYPRWFATARRMTSLMVLVFVSVCGSWVFLYEQPVC